VLGLSPGGPAERSGKVKIGDVVTAVNGVNMHSRVRDRGDASRGGVPAPGSIEGLLSGKAGTSVVLTIKRTREGGDGMSTFHGVLPYCSPALSDCPPLPLPLRFFPLFTVIQVID
jgi:hypothetical protein